MNEYAAYLVNKLKDANMTTIVIKHRYVHKDGHKKWDKPWNDELPDYKKCSIVGGHIFGLITNSFINHNACVFGSAIDFNDSWTDIDENISYDIHDPKLLNDAYLSNFLESCFLQCLTMTEKQNVYLNGRILFNKGEAYRYMMEADLM